MSQYRDREKAAALVGAALGGLIRPRHEHLAKAASPGIKTTRSLAREVKGINAKVAIIVPAILGSMTMFWIANVLALCSLPAVLVAFDHEVLRSGSLDWIPKDITKVSLIALVAWLAQTYIQLVALPVLQVSNNAQMAQNEEHTAAVLRGVERAEDALNLETEGGLQAVNERIARLAKRVEELHGS